MEIRGERECTACGTRWSYYETGSVHCPACGNIRSVATEDERREHTDGVATLALDDAVAAAGRDDYRAAAREARGTVRDYTHERGFVRGGDLRDLDDTVLAAWELRYVAAAFARAFDHSEAEAYYFVSLLRGAPAGERPDASDVPESMRAARGNGYADAVADYRADVRRYLDTGPERSAANDLLASLDDHVRRIHALDGDVPPATADRLVAAARAIGRYARDGDAADETAAREALDELSS
ncbi:putative RNA-binding Zn-ribbon protein involved in translation (DUF1610 family) [Halarchaeum rubridurum]|uniref:Putative RNA-binding Zn-ribbon protein involved in translation (DUF1610 family) n=1 Tax=Halarchaeum rubridurum TaxID=489911 RepID=A0A830FSF0_9EURY|nr:TFIIB-type zinc ribbon-containing protein [Halarchaeum rubridurum]MBP1953705.1 putative RNA-binding Zn-ribbon protein involved in translation (DUF1610 family) [Halarchaeum rubridurum]GGM54029.1 hypothetical protein GCM10009017_00460 [Halarchaeum rubridurum]